MRRPSLLVVFLVATFTWSWTLWTLASRWELPGAWADGLVVAGRFGPSLAAIAVTLAAAGRDGLAALLAPFRRWRAPIWLWLVVVFGPIVVVLAAIGLASLLGTPPGPFNDPGTAYLVVPVFVVILVAGGPLGEELGWRGFALDRLQHRTNPVAASVLLGVMWGLWHLPLFRDPTQVQASLPILLYLGQTTSTAVLYTWLWNRTRSLPMVLVLHTVTNLAAGVFPLLRPEAADHLAFGFAVTIAATGALLLIVATGGRLGWQATAFPAVISTSPRHPSPSGPPRDDGRT
jgi:uncharacterized protein